MENIKGKNTIIKVVLAVVVIAVVAATSAIITMMVSGTAPSGGNISETVTGEETVGTEPLKVEVSENNAKSLFSCRVDDTSDTAAVVKLFEAMGLEDVTGEYTVKIEKKKDMQVLTLNVKSPVAVDDKQSFDADVMVLAEQIMALVSDVDKVVWNYNVETGEAISESASVSMDIEGAREKLSRDVKKLGVSEKAVYEMLTIQAELI